MVAADKYFVECWNHVCTQELQTKFVHGNGDIFITHELMKEIANVLCSNESAYPQLQKVVQFIADASKLFFGIVKEQILESVQYKKYHLQRSAFQVQYLCFYKKQGKTVIFALVEHFISVAVTGMTISQRNKYARYHDGKGACQKAC